MRKLLQVFWVCSALFVGLIGVGLFVRHNQLDSGGKKISGFKVCVSLADKMAYDKAKGTNRTGEAIVWCLTFSTGCVVRRQRDIRRYQMPPIF